MSRWYYGLVATVGLLVGYLSMKVSALLAWLNAPVRVEPNIVKLGELVEGNEASFTVNIANRTDRPMKLVRVHFSVCGCFFERQKLPDIVLPHSKVPISFGVKTEQLPDQFQAQLSFVLAEPSGATYTAAANLIGSVRKEIAITPTFLDFGTVLLGGATSRTVSFQSLTGKVFEIERVEAPTEITVSHPNEPSTKVHMQVTFRPRNSPGWREGKIKFRLKGLLRQQIELPFKASVDGVIDTEPNFLNFGTVSPGESKDLKFRIINRSGMSFKLRLTSCPKFVRVIKLRMGLSGSLG